MTVFSWGSFCALANDLVAETRPRFRDAALRSAVSRTYYAAFHSARLRLEAEGTVVPKDGTAHSFVIRCFRESDDVKRRHIAKSLAELRDDRRDADYEDLSSVAADAREIITQAETLLREIAELP